MLAAIARGRTRIRGANEGEDVAATMRALRALGVRVVASGEVVVVEGTAALRRPRRVVDCGNSGTTMRLLMGLLAGRVHAMLDGDRSLRRRPMERVAAPLRTMGADIATGRGGTPPVSIKHSPGGLRGIRYRLPVASAQLKSALLIAGLHAQSATVLGAATSSRDHTERLLRLMGAGITVQRDQITLRPGALKALGEFRVPGDISAAFYLIAASAVVPGSVLTVRDVGLNPTRTAALDVLRSMGAAIDIRLQRSAPGAEPRGQVSVCGGGALRGIDVLPALVPNLLDEIPALCAVAAMASGVFRVRGAGELRVKESDRIARTVELLRAFGVNARAFQSGIEVRGGSPLRAPRVVGTWGDHRIGLAAVVLAAAARSALTIRDSGCIATSFPDFSATWKALFGEG